MSAIAACPGCVVAPAIAQTAPQSGPPDLVLSLPAIHCATCINTVERSLRALPQVRSARVNLSLKRVSIHASDLDAEQAVATLDRAGIEAHPLDQSLLESRQDDIGRGLLIRLAIAGFAMMNVMLFSVAIWSGASDATRALFHLISAVITLPAVLFCGQPFFANGMRAVRRGGLNMDVPISLAILLAAGMSLYEVLNGGHHAYFDAALSLTFFLLVGRYLDHRTRTSVHSAAKELAALEVQTAQRVHGTGVERVAVGLLRVGDTVLVPTGMRVPVDGVLNSAAAQADRSFLTGESAAVALTLGDVVQAGEINLGAPFEMTATAVGEDTTLRRVAALVEMAENSRNSYTNLADRAARIYAPMVHLLALAAFVGWVAYDGDLRHALNVAVAVLIITCPCALGLAVPAVATTAIARLFDMGFLVKSGTALERLAEVDMAVFDKTGTLTRQGKPAPLAELSVQQSAIAGALAQASAHPVAQAILAALPVHTPAVLADVTEVAGQGMQGDIDGVTVRLGRGEWLGAAFSGTGLRIGSAPAVPLAVTETPREGAADTLAWLSAQGITPHILSGDRQATVQAFAAKLGVQSALGDISAPQKHDRLAQLQAQGHRVLMVGDGLNDTAALALAHASVAPSSALDASRNAADVVMLREGLDQFPLLIVIARALTRLSRQNFAIAAGYNAIAIPVALLGYATPLLAAIAMSASSLTVLANAMRVKYVK
ncbi:MAG: heavy metal translocating P-type ATPase [Rhodobacterales bacterium]